MAREKPITIHRGSYTIQKLPAKPSPFETHSFIFNVNPDNMVFMGPVHCLSICIRDQASIYSTGTSTAISEILLDFPSAVLSIQRCLGGGDLDLDTACVI